jgi:hypothetical protein
VSWRRRQGEDEAVSEPEAPERAVRPWSRYAQSVGIVVRETAEPDDESVASAVSASFIEVDLDLPLEEFVPEVSAWLAERRGDFFKVEIGRSYSNAGASFVGAELLITFLGTAGGTVAGVALYDALLAFVKQRFGLGERDGGTRVDWLRSLDEGFAQDYVAGHVARAIDCRRSDLTLVEFVLDENEARAVYDLGDDRYEVRVDETAYRISQGVLRHRR